MPPRPTMPADDLYGRLGVPIDASPEAIDIAWRGLLRRHHPDVAGPEANELAKRINVAHDWLSDPALRRRYDRERGIGSGSFATSRRPGDGPVMSPARATVRRPPTVAERVAAVIERVGHLTVDDLDRLGLAEPAPIAFLATLRRFVSPELQATLDDAEQAALERLPYAARRDPAIGDAIAGKLADLILGDALDELVGDPDGVRVHERLTRGWDAAVGQPRYGPATGPVHAFLERLASLTPAEVRALAATGSRDRLGEVPWPGGVSPEEDDALRVSSELAGRDAAAALTGPGVPAGARRAAARIAHLLVLRHAIHTAEFERLAAPWLDDLVPRRAPVASAGRPPLSLGPGGVGRPGRRRSPRPSVGRPGPPRPPGRRSHAARLCDARPVDAWIVVALLLAIALVVCLVLLARRDHTVRRVVLALGSDAAPSPGEAPEAAVLRLRGDAEGLDRRLVAEGEALTALTEMGGTGILRLDDEPRIRAANAAAHEILGRTPGSLAGRSLIEAFLDPQAEAVVVAAARTGSAATELRLAGPDGPALALRARPIPSGGSWLVIEDVSELRRLQRIRAEFIDNLSHELRTPLTTVSLLAETLAREAEAAGEAVSPRMRDRIAKIEVETGHLVQMVSELLDLSRIESGGTLQFNDGLDLGQLAAESTDRLRLFAERQGVTLRTEVDQGLPPVRGDGARLGQVVINLVHNAVKFSPDGGDVVVRARHDGREVVVSVEDHGVGIPRSAQPRVFERFYKVDRARLRAEAGGGTGLGLAIARHVIQQHGGRIWVRSEEGVGSTFSFALPARVAPER